MSDNPGNDEDSLVHAAENEDGVVVGQGLERLADEWLDLEIGVTDD